MNAKGALSLLAALVPSLAAAQSVVQDDVKPSIVLYSTGDSSLALGGLFQLHLAPYVGDDAQLADEDPAGRAGFRLRRARLGVEAKLPSDVELMLTLNPLESDPETGAISEARVRWSFKPWMRVWAGADKVPFSYGELISSADLSSIERPLVVRTLVPQRRLGAALEGSVLGDLSYVVGVMNATEGYELGNRFSGILYLARLQYGMTAGDFNFGVGAGGYFEDGAATRRLAGSADLRAGFLGASILVEAICDKTTPEDSPETSPEVPDAVTRCGGYAEAEYRLRDPALGVVARLELLDDNRAVEDAGDAWLVAGGLNWRATRNVRLQLHYLGRYERKSNERANDSVILNVQGEL